MDKQVVGIYDAIAVEYDGRYEDVYSRIENQAVKAIIREVAPDATRVLDVGAGTGLALDLGIAAIAGYTGLEPSEGMRERLHAKHPGAELTGRSVAEWLPGEPDIDLIIALFGVGSYLSSADYNAIEAHQAPAIVMTYRPGYLPDYYEDDYPDSYFWAWDRMMMQPWRLIAELSGKHMIWGKL